MTLVDALSVARAALMEVGGDLDDVGLSWNGEGLSSAPNAQADQAALLGMMAEYGPHYVVRCRTCIDCRWSIPCTPVRDVLRGVTCGGGS